MWRCPLCQSDLTLSPIGAHCTNQHTFDRAKSGYLNLLPVQFKKSRHPGDDKAMLRARQTFHELKGYAPLMESIARLIGDNYLSNGRAILFDAGCGEGTYVDTVSQLLRNNGIDVQSCGGDIAKVAVDIASKAYKQYQFIVASSVNLPLTDNCLDILLQVFAPGSAEEQKRVLRDDGLLVTVDPGPDHLCELKSLVYETPRQHTLPASQRPGFRHVSTDFLRYPLSFSSQQQKSALLGMTPYMWRVSPDKRTSLAEGLETVTVEFVIQLWQPEKREKKDGSL